MPASSPASEAGLTASAADGDFAAALAALREAGADRFDPVRFRYLEAMASRTAGQPAAARQVLERKLREALADYVTRRQQAVERTAQLGDELARRFPAARGEIGALVAHADERGLRQLRARLEARGADGPLSELLRCIDRPLAAPGEQEPATPAAAAPRELKALRQSRATWTRLSVDRKMQQSQASIPVNPGPLNSNLLILRALQAMQEVSPSYLQCFISHLETLSWLDGAAAASAPPPAKAAPADGGRRRSGRGKSR